MLAPEDENEAEVRREDQENINRFARVNARLSHVREQKEERKVRYPVQFVDCQPLTTNVALTPRRKKLKSWTMPRQSL